MPGSPWTYQLPEVAMQLSSFGAWSQSFGVSPWCCRAHGFGGAQRRARGSGLCYRRKGARSRAGILANPAAQKTAGNAPRGGRSGPLRHIIYFAIEIRPVNERSSEGRPIGDVRADFDRLESFVGWAKARTCAPCPPDRSFGWARFALPTLQRFHMTGTRSTATVPRIASARCG